MAAPPTIDLLLNLVPDSPSSVLSSLTSHPQLAKAADVNGYTLLHAAASYSHLDLLRALVETYSVDPNIRDSDGDTPLFYAEIVEVAKCLVEELGADASAQNEEGESVADRADSEEWVLVASYLRSKSAPADSATNGATTAPEAAVGSNSNAGHPPPPLPEGVRINIGHIVEGADAESAAGAPDPEFRRRIEELAARDDFQGEEGQRQLRELITEAVRGVADDVQNNQDGRETKRR